MVALLAVREVASLIRGLIVVRWIPPNVRPQVVLRAGLFVERK
jgi:hypothetical protein